jgi:hypothetical protein
MVCIRIYLLINAAYKMSFFSRGSHGRNKRGRRNWNRGPRRPRFSIHFDADPQELNQLFQARFFNWIGQGAVQPRPERHPFQPQHVPGIPVPPHVSLQPEVPNNNGWQEIVHPTVSQHRGWTDLSLPTPPSLVKPNVQISPAYSPVQSSHAIKRLKTESHHMHDKGKVDVAPSSPSSDSTKSVSSRMHLKGDCSHVISEIKPQGSTQPKVNLGKSKRDRNNKGKIYSQSGKYDF